MESSSSQVTTFSSPCFAARSLLKRELLQPQLAQHLLVSASEQIVQNPHSRHSTTAPELCLLCSVTTKQQHTWFLGFLFSTPPWDVLAAASRPQRLGSNPPAGCPSCPLAGHRQSLGGTVPLPVHAQLQPPPRLLGAPRGAPGWPKGQRLSWPKCTRGGTDRYPGSPGAHRAVTPRPKHRLPSASLPGSLSPHRGCIFITVAKGDQLHPYNRPLHKTNRPGNWDRPVKYFIVWTRGVRATAHKLSQLYIPGITVLFLPVIPTFSLGAA